MPRLDRVQKGLLGAALAAFLVAFGGAFYLFRVAVAPQPVQDRSSFVQVHATVVRAYLTQEQGQGQAGRHRRHDVPWLKLRATLAGRSFEHAVRVDFAHPFRQGRTADQVTREHAAGTPVVAWAAPEAGLLVLDLDHDLQSPVGVTWAAGSTCAGAAVLVVTMVVGRRRLRQGRHSVRPDARSALRRPPGG